MTYAPSEPPTAGWRFVMGWDERGVVMLTSEDRAQVSEAAEAIQEAAGKVRDLLDVPGADRKRLAEIQFQVQDARRDLLEAWS